MKLFKKKEDTVEKTINNRIKRMLDVGYFEGDKEEMTLLLKQDVEYRKAKNDKLRFCRHHFVSRRNRFELFVVPHNPVFTASPAAGRRARPRVAGQSGVLRRA